MRCLSVYWWLLPSITTQVQFLENLQVGRSSSGFHTCTCVHWYIHNTCKCFRFCKTLSNLNYTLRNCLNIVLFKANHTSQNYEQAIGFVSASLRILQT
ncbi:hypothetical protein LEMLEM_LOCUS12196 [Lemmus lemmus]